MSNPGLSLRDHIMIPLALYQRMAACYYGDGPRAHSPSEEDLDTLRAPGLTPPIDAALESLSELEEAQALLGPEGSPKREAEQEAIIREPFEMPGFVPQGLNKVARKPKT